MHFFVWVVCILFVVMITGVGVGTFYLRRLLNNNGEEEALLQEIEFTKVHTSLSNSAGDNAWVTTNDIQATLGKVDKLRTFFAPIEWEFSPPVIPTQNLDLPLFLILPENAKSIKSFLAGSTGIVYPPGSGYNNILGKLTAPNEVTLYFATGEVISERAFTGRDTHAFMVLGFAILYVAPTA